MRSHKGFFITFEKTKEGLGGTTQANHLADNLKKAGYDVVLTKEPGGTELGQHLRQILLDPKQKLSKATELFLQLADRSQHYKEVLKPSLKAGKIVISDRYFDSTLAYQGAGSGWKSAFLWRLHQAATGSLLPDLTFILHGTPFRERDLNDRFERKGEDFHMRVERTMLHLAAKGGRYVLLNANQDEQELANEILALALERMQKSP